MLRYWSSRRYSTFRTLVLLAADFSSSTNWQPAALPRDYIDKSSTQLGQCREIAGPPRASTAAALLSNIPPEPPVLPFNIQYWYWYCQYRVNGALCA